MSPNDGLGLKTGPKIPKGLEMAYVAWSEASPQVITRKPLGEWPARPESAIWYAVQLVEHPQTKDMVRVANIPAEVIQRYGLRPGDEVFVKVCRDPRLAEQDPILSIDPAKGKVMGIPNTPVMGHARARVDREVQEFPSGWIPTYRSGLIGRVLDLIAAIFYGSRMSLFAPPKVGKTTFLTALAQGILLWIMSLPWGERSKYRMAFLGVDERPEETRFPFVDTVFPAPYDRSPQFKLRLVELYVEWVKRQIESGIHVICFVDSLTRLGMFFNMVVQSTGGSLSGGLSKEAFDQVRRVYGMHGLYPPEKGMGSATCIATVLIETGNKADDIIAEQLKGAGNTDVMMSRGLATQELYPAVVMYQAGDNRGKKEAESSTRRMHEELAPFFGYTADVMRRKIAYLRRWLDPEAKMEEQNRRIVALARGIEDPGQVWSAIDPEDFDASAAELAGMCVDEDGQWDRSARNTVKIAFNATIAVLFDRDPTLLLATCKQTLAKLAQAEKISLNDLKQIGRQLIQAADELADVKGKR
ncbi:hypothetical protein HGA91_03085 [candidate division WWE3 bacterium]|nr:hypothetical protein [candidate division WWE3 bacterium]